MRVQIIAVSKSSISADRIRVSAEIVCDTHSVPTEVYWFDVPERYSDYLSQSGSPWLACLIPFAVNLGEPLRISGPVDSVLLENVRELMQIWKCWYPHLHVVPIEAELTRADAVDHDERTAALFSGGVDAWFTLLRHAHNPTAPGATRITDLLTVWGFDIALDNPDGFKRMQDVQEKAAAEFGLEPIVVTTNLHQTHWWRGADWGRVAHGAALATIGLILERRYGRLLVPSTHRYDDLLPWGSHSLTDPLFSTSSMKVIHDGAAFSRVQKTEFLTRFESAMNSLQVCWETKSYKNCEACNKCYRTMMTLMLLNALERCPTFAATTVSPRKVGRMFSQDESDRAFLREVRALAVEKGRADIARAIDKSFRHSKRLKTWLPLIRSLNKRRFVWRWAAPLERRLLANSIVK